MTHIGSVSPLQIIEESAVTELLSQAAGTWPRVIELFDDLTWLLSRKGKELGTERTYNGRVHRLYKTQPNPVAGIPCFILVYEIADGRLRICALRIC
jgi:hypothetical protein